MDSPKREVACRAKIERGNDRRGQSDRWISSTTLSLCVTLVLILIGSQSVLSIVYSLESGPTAFKLFSTGSEVSHGLIPERARQIANNSPRSTLMASATSKKGQTSGPTNFQARCSSPGVIRCVGFDSPADIVGKYGDNSGILVGATKPVLDAAIKASGESSLKFTIPSKSGADTSGSYFANFSEDLSSQFGENSEFYVQWRQRFSPEFLNTRYDGGEGWKQVIIGTGDQPGHLYSSCSALEVVVQNTYQRGFARIYDSCTGSASHGAYDPFSQPFATPWNGANFKLQNAMHSPYCLYDNQGKSQLPPTGNCFGYFPNEWMTFQVHVKMGPRVNDEFTNSFVQLWIAREGQPSRLVIDWGRYNLSAGDATEGQKFGKIWLLPYHTGKNASQVHAPGFVWYDELIVSRQRVPDPQ